METDTTPITARLEERIKAFGFSRFGWARLERPLTMELYVDWLKEGYHADMTYLAKHVDAKEKPQKLLARAHSALVVAVDYLPHPRPLPPEWPVRAARTAFYSRGEDYHYWLKQQLDSLAQELRDLFPGEEFIAFTDSSPVLERDLARRAGLGWIGKNTCLIDEEKGSLFFIGEIYTTLAISHQATTLHPDRCGKCRKCIDACPTQALVADRVLDARRCIAYWTIEARRPPPVDLLPKMQDWLFGCDICQTVCPWNIKAFGPNSMSTPSSDPMHLTRELEWILTSSNRMLSRALRRSPLLRSGPYGLKRNALVIAGNRKLMALRPLIDTYALHPRLGDLAQWALGQMSF